MRWVARESGLDLELGKKGKWGTLARSLMTGGNPFYDAFFDSHQPIPCHWLIGRPLGASQARDMIWQTCSGVIRGGSPRTWHPATFLLYSGLPEWLPVAPASGCARTVPYPHPGPLRGLFGCCSGQPICRQNDSASPGQLLGGAISAHQGFHFNRTTASPFTTTLHSTNLNALALYYSGYLQPTCTSGLTALK